MNAAAFARNLIVASIAIGATFLSFDTRSQAALRPLPPVLRTISDEVGALSVPEGQALAQSIAEVQQGSGVRIIVVIAETTGVESIEEYMQRLSAHWRAYGPSPDGEERVFVVVAVADRTLRIASEKQMASVVEQVTKSSLMADLLPMFRRGEYFRALALIVEQLSRAIGALPSAGDKATWNYPAQRVSLAAETGHVVSNVVQDSGATTPESLDAGHDLERRRMLVAAARFPAYHAPREGVA